MHAVRAAAALSTCHHVLACAAGRAAAGRAAGQRDLRHDDEARRCPHRDHRSELPRSRRAGAEERASLSPSRPATALHALQRLGVPVGLRFIFVFTLPLIASSGIAMAR